MEPYEATHEVDFRKLLDDDSYMTSKNRSRKGKIGNGLHNQMESFSLGQMNMSTRGLPTAYVRVFEESYSEGALVLNIFCICLDGEDRFVGPTT